MSVAPVPDEEETLLMTHNDGRRRAARFALTAGIATAAAVTGVAGTAYAGTPGAQPLGTVRAAAAGAISDSYIVVLKDATAAEVPGTARALANRYGGEVEQSWSATVRGFQADMTQLEARRLAASSEVAYVEQDATVRLADVSTQYNPVWGLDRADQRSLPLSKTYSHPSAADVTAYVLDTGIRTTHSEFGGRASSGWDFIQNDATAQDCNGHGTHVAGTVGGRTYGMAKDVSLVGVRVLDCKGVGSYSAIIGGVDWVTRNASLPAVANMSVGGTASSALNAAVARSVAAGVTYVVAAGNENKKACGFSPASASSAITVGATDSKDARASFSNFGSCLDLFAPGVKITSASYKSDSAASIMSGTSMASPLVAGAAALVVAKHPGWTPAQVTAELLAESTPNKVTQAGTGSPNKLLWTGFLNAESATNPAAAAVCGPYVMGTDRAIAKKGTAISAKKITGCSGTASASSSVTVTVKHPYRGSLVVTLISPAGVAYSLKSADKADTTANLSQTYPIDLSGTKRAGKWTLTVKDTYGTAAGTLDKWKLQF